MNDQLKIERIMEKDNAPLAALIRRNLEKHHLDLPGTVYYDESLDHLSDFYLADPGRTYLVLKDEKGTVCGGIGLAAFEPIEGCCELQKLYLADAQKGRGLSYLLIDRIEQEAIKRGYRKMYLETHTNLQAAIHVYEKSGYQRIRKPEAVVHQTMDTFFLKNLLLKEAECCKIV